MARKRTDRPNSFDVTAKSAALLMIVWAATPVLLLAQRPFFANDALYRDETARRTYHHGYAISGEVSYRSVDANASGVAGNVGLLFGLDYQLSQQFDVSAILDLIGGPASQDFRLSWLAVKHRWHSDGADMAVRLAFEPRPPIGGGIGFRQTDMGFFYSKVLSPLVETEIALGVRHVRTGFPAPGQVGPRFDFNESRGYEAHLVLAYNLVFDPARSHISIAFGYEAGRYDVTERVLPPIAPSPGFTKEFAGHVLWIRIGLHWNRPSYQLVPFIRVPMVAGKRGDGFVQGKGPRYINLGVRVTLR